MRGNRSFLFMLLEPPRGIEPRTYRLQGGCSTPELRWRGLIIQHTEKEGKPSSYVPALLYAGFCRG